MEKSIIPDAMSPDDTEDLYKGAVALMKTTKMYEEIAGSTWPCALMICFGMHMKKFNLSKEEFMQEATKAARICSAMFD